MARVGNSFDAGTDGATITTGNSGTSGDAFQDVTHGGVGTTVYNAANAFFGGMAAALNPDAGFACYLGYNTSLGTLTDIYGRVYVMFPSLPAATQLLVAFYDSVTATNRGRISVQTDGRLRFVNAAGTTIGTTASALVAGSYARIEWHFIGDPTAGLIECYLYLSPNSATATQVVTLSSQNTGGSTTSYRIGQAATTATDLGVFYLDEIVWDTAGYPGPIQPRPPLIDQSGVAFAPDEVRRETPIVKTQNYFDGGTDGATITTGNSGGQSGNAFQDVTHGGVGTSTYNAANKLYGTNAAALDPDAGFVNYLGYTTVVGARQFVYGRVYAKFPALPAATQTFVLFRDSGSATNRGRISIQTDGRIRLVDAAGVTRATSTTGFTAGSWARLEWYFAGSTTAGELEAKFFSTYDSIVPDWTLNSGVIDTTGSVDTFRIGQTASTATDLGVFYLDEIEWNTGAYPGPVQPRMGFIDNLGVALAPSPQMKTLTNFIDRQGVALAPSLLPPKLVSMGFIDQAGTASAPSFPGNALTPPTIESVWSGDWGGTVWGGSPYAFRPTIKFTMGPGFIDRAGVALTPSLNPNQFLIPFIDRAGVAFSPQPQFQTKPGFIDNAGVALTPFVGNGVSSYQIGPGFIDQAGTAFTHTVNPNYLQMGFINQTGAPFPMALMWLVKPGFIDQIGTPFAPAIGVSNVLMSFIDNAGTAFAPKPNMALAGAFVDQAGTAFAPGINVNQVRPTFIDQAGEIFAPEVVRGVLPDIKGRARAEVIISHRARGVVIISHRARGTVQDV